MSEITKTEDRRGVSLPMWIWAAFAVFVVSFYLFGLTIPLLGPDEPRYAQVAREMYERGDWVTPTLGGFNWFEKPALLYWLQIASYRVFGISEFAARFGSALFGLGTIASLWLIGRSAARFEISNLKSQISDPGYKLSSSDLKSDLRYQVSSFPRWLALIAASTFGIIVFSRGASFDIIITFPITAALVCFFIFYQSEERASGKKTVPLIAFYVFIGIALLAKGLIGVVFPLAIVALFYLLSRRVPSRAFIISLFWGTLLAAAVAAVWYVPMYLRHGGEFIDQFFLQHHFQRFTSNKYRHPQPFYFFFWVLPLMTLPWMPFFLASLAGAMRTAFRRSRTSPLLPFSPSPLLLFSSAWLIVPLAFFSFSGSKLPGYILPAVPAAIIITSVYVFDLIRRSNAWSNAVLTICGSTFAGLILLLVFTVPSFADSDSVKSLIAAANERGYTSNRVLTLHTISHNAEFYAAGRLGRDETGKQKRLAGNNELLAAINAGAGRPVIVLVPLEHLAALTSDNRFATEALTNNRELAVAIVSIIN